MEVTASKPKKSRLGKLRTYFSHPVIRWPLNAAGAALVLFLGVAHIVPAVVGWMPLAVYTGSMTPTYQPGDAVVVEMVDDSSKPDIGVGDVITFMPESNSSTLITHRVVAMGASQDGQPLYTTQGDANSSTDDPVLLEQVRGKVLYRVPLYGHVLLAIPNDARSVGRIVLAVAAGLYVLWQVISIFRKPKKTPTPVAESAHVDVEKEHPESTSDTAVPEPILEESSR